MLTFGDSGLSVLLLVRGESRTGKESRDRQCGVNYFGCGVAASQLRHPGRPTVAPGHNRASVRRSSTRCCRVGRWRPAVVLRGNGSVGPSRRRPAYFLSGLV